MLNTVGNQIGISTAIYVLREENGEYIYIKIATPNNMDYIGSLAFLTKSLPIEDTLKP